MTTTKSEGRKKKQKEAEKRRRAQKKRTTNKERGGKVDREEILTRRTNVHIQKEEEYNVLYLVNALGKIYDVSLLVTTTTTPLESALFRI